MSESHEIERLREKARHDESQALYHAEQKGIQKGIQRGIQKGIQQGIQKGAAEEKLEIAKSLLKINLPLDHISRVTGLAIAEIENLQ